MPIRKIPFVPFNFYHIYNRGNSKQKIFKDQEDYKRFVGLLYACNQKDNFKSDNLRKSEGLFNTKIEDTIVAVGAYCLMPNHFHLLVTSTDKEGISKFIQKVTTAYVMYYNKKHKRTGGLFEGKFKSEHADSDRYLKYLFSYIHLNPVKLIDKNWKERGIKDKTKVLTFLDQYKYSSFLDYLGENRVQNKVLNMIMFPKYFPKQKDFIKEIFEWLNYSNK